MTERDLLFAINELDEKYIEEASPKQKRPFLKINIYKKWLPVVACLLLVLLVSVQIIMHFGKSNILGEGENTPDGENTPGGEEIPGGNGESSDTPDGENGSNGGAGGGIYHPPVSDTFADEVTKVEFQGFLYEYAAPTDRLLFAYPKIEEIREKTDAGYKLNVNDGDIGEYIAPFPAVPELELPLGEAYHLAVYPEYDSIIIVKYPDGYRLFISDGELSESGPTVDGDFIIDKLSLDGSVEYYTKGDDTETLFTDDSALSALLSVLRGKARFSDASSIAKRKWEGWCESHGDSSVWYEGDELKFESYDVRKEYALFYGSTIKTLFLTTSRGFDVRVDIDCDYGYIFMCGRYYFLISNGEASLLNEAFDLN